MTYLVDRLAELRRHLDHLRVVKSRVFDRASLQDDLSLHNDVLFSLLMVAQLTVDISGELAARRGDRFDGYAEAIRMLGRDRRFPPDLVSSLEPLAGFRNIVIHEYVKIDLNRVIEALNRLDPVERFVTIVAGLQTE